MKGRPYSTERDGTRQRFELLALQRSLSRPAGGPIPVRLCLYVDQLILAQRKSQFLAVDATIKEQGRAASLLEDNQQRLIPESIVDHGLSLQLVERPGSGFAALGNPDQKLGRIAIEFAAILPRCSAQRHHGRVWVLRAPRLPIGHDRGNGCQTLTLKRSLHRLTEDVAPETLGLGIQHDEAAVPEHAGDGKSQIAILDLSGIHDAVVTKVSPRRGHRSASKRVVQDFPLRASQHVDWI